MARRDESKPMLPATRVIVPCAGRSDCRFPGRLWLRTLGHNERVCINHYYSAIEQDHSLAHDKTVPPRAAT